MPRCAGCGAESPEGARFCASCGRNLEEQQPRPEPALGFAPAKEDLATADRILTEAFAHSEQGRLTEAVRLAEQALTYNPNSTTAHSLLGTLYERLGNRDAAIREYQTVLSLSPGSTADRQRLNELLGVPAAPAPRPPAAIPIPRAVPKAAGRPNTAYIGGFAFLAVVLVGGTILLLSHMRNLRSEASSTPPAEKPAVVSDYRIPRQELSIPATSLPMPGVPTGSSAPTSVPSESGTAGFPLAFDFNEPNLEEMEDTGYYDYDAEYEAEPPEAEMWPATLEFPGYIAPIEPPPRFLPGGGKVLESPPVIRVVSRPSTKVTAARSVSQNVKVAHQLVVSGRLQEAREVYETTLAARPTASPKLRQELATVYFRLNRPAKARENYYRAYKAYQVELDQGSEGIEAQEAEHGLATCRAALRALGVEVP
ncbi:MAG: tetratricopeptide repeat protein [Armatimonadetes bacterium]|nr:tetratricopeptide repeat protein [Armatimonadota bacterium]NIM23842.1 tetratricopeptide repeat protein [Armatimonadota bacterium]NIM67721.1 tetratricopeptide repeat protein [Armatimonadota bacterium]NIM76230.1 tetratricopeptide repeat protein [Armatimonadota bacterium]NIN05923.1 tetratricopeptide repeat protein [Armatimonadota bacterium]